MSVCVSECVSSGVILWVRLSSRKQFEDFLLFDMNIPVCVFVDTLCCVVCVCVCVSVYVCVSQTNNAKKKTRPTTVVLPICSSTEHVFNVFPVFLLTIHRFTSLSVRVCRACTLLFFVCVCVCVCVMLCYHASCLQRTHVKTV